jgi:hypothetical protein
LTVVVGEFTNNNCSACLFGRDQRENRCGHWCAANDKTIPDNLLKLRPGFFATPSLGWFPTAATISIRVKWSVLLFKGP